MLSRKCWTLSCMAHASKGAVAMDAPASVTQAVRSMQRMVAAELELVVSLDEDMSADDEDRMAATESIYRLQCLEQVIGEDEARRDSTKQGDIETQNFILLVGSATSKRRAAYALETGWAGAPAPVVQWAAAMDGTREGARVFLASLREVLMTSATALSMMEFASSVLGPSVLQGEPALVMQMIAGARSSRRPGALVRIGFAGSYAEATEAVQLHETVYGGDAMEILQLTTGEIEREAGETCYRIDLEDAFLSDALLAQMREECIYPGRADGGGRWRRSATGEGVEHRSPDGAGQRPAIVHLPEDAGGDLHYHPRQLHGGG